MSNRLKSIDALNACSLKGISQSQERRAIGEDRCSFSTPERCTERPWRTVRPLVAGGMIILINISKIVPIELFKSRVDGMIRKLRSARKARGSERIYLPGEIEWECRKDTLKNGIPLPELTLAALRSAGEDIGLDTQFLNG